MLPETFQAFLVFLGGNIFVGIVVSKLLEPRKWFQSLDGAGKSNVVLALHLALGILSYFLVSNLSPEFITKVQPFYAMIAAIISQYLASTEYHDAVTEKRESAKTEVSVAFKAESSPVDTQKG